MLSTARRSSEPPTTNKSQSGIFRLPIEVREHIWRLAIGTNAVHFVERHGVLHAVPCPSSKGALGLSWGSGCTILTQHVQGDTTVCLGGEPLESQVRVGALGALLRTCKSLHSEVSTAFFTTTTLAFYDIEHLINVHAFVKSPQLQCTRSVVLVWGFILVRGHNDTSRNLVRRARQYMFPSDWMASLRAACDKLASLPDLRELVVHIRGLLAPAEWAFLTNELRRVQPAARFDVVVYGQPDLAVADVEGAPFRVFEGQWELRGAMIRPLGEADTDLCRIDGKEIEDSWPQFLQDRITEQETGEVQRAEQNAPNRLIFLGGNP